MLRQLQYIEPASLGRIVALLSTAFTFVVGTPGVIRSLFLGIGWPFFKLLGIVFVAGPVVSLLFGFCTGYLIAAIYNLVADRFGGIEFDVSVPGLKRPTDQ